jgi:hypothetical protein
MADTSMPTLLKHTIIFPYSEDQRLLECDVWGFRTASIEDSGFVVRDTIV